MNYLSHYFQPRYTTLLNKYNGMFAFSDKQFDEQKKPNMVYLSMGGGLLLGYPDNLDQSREAKIQYGKEYMQELETISIQSRQDDIDENGIINIIRRELNNHEADYTGDISDTVEALRLYPGITPELIEKCFHNKNFTI